MEVVTIGSLLESGIPCSSSSLYLAESSHSESSPGVNSTVLACEAVRNVLGKRTRGWQRRGTSSKPVGPDCQPMRVLSQCWVIIGRLQLCNRSVHFWNGIYVAADCVALTDSTATICCCVRQGPDPRFVEKIVRVTSWTFIPRKATPLTRVQLPGSVNSKSQLGILEVHSLEVVDGQSPKDLILPSLYVSPPANDGNFLPKENPLAQEERQGKELSLRGIPHSISPPFILPCKQQHRKSHSQAGSSQMQDRDEDSNGNVLIERMLGFFVEIRSCAACCKSCFETWNDSVKREIGRPGKRIGSVHETGPPCSKAAQSTATIHPNSTGGNFLPSSRPPEAARTVGSTTRPESDGSILRVYYSGAVSAWRPVLSGMMGRCITITGLRKKLILVGNDEKPHVVFFATLVSLIALECGMEPASGWFRTLPFKELKRRSDPLNKRRGSNDSKLEAKKLRCDFGTGSSSDRFCTAERGHGEYECVDEGLGKTLDLDSRVISFVGVVTDCLFQGTLLELDERVWLLLTHQRHATLHVLRIGALLSLRDVHAITLKDLMGKVLLLGACMHSHVSVVQYSPLLTQPSRQVNSKSLLLKHIQRLSFPSTFWLLSLIGSFRLKFRDIYNNRALLGGKKDPGIIQKYAQRMIPPDRTPERVYFGCEQPPGFPKRTVYVSKEMIFIIARDIDVVKEFFQKRHCQLGDTLLSTPLLKVPPIANFLEHVQALWRNSSSLDFLSGKPGVGQLRQLTISSQELGVILLGSLQVCKTSGELHLSDSTGVVGVLIADLMSSEHLTRTYQVSRFTVLLEGLGQATSPADSEIGNASLSWSSLLKEVEAVPRFERVNCSVRFFMRDASHVQELDWCENSRGQPAPTYRLREKKSWSEKQAHEKWTRRKSHLEFLRLWFRSQAADVESASCSEQGLGILCELVGDSVPSDHLFRVSCKVMAVRFLVFDWPGGPRASETRNIGVKCSAIGGKPSFGIPLTLACFVVDDGSGPVDCWALGDAAVSLLGLSNVTGQLKLPDAVLERVCTNLAVESGAPPSMGLSLEQILCRVTQRYGQIVIQKSDRLALMNGKGGKSLNDDERSLMHLLIAGASLNGPVVVVGMNIPSMKKVCSSHRENSTGLCETLAFCSPPHPRDPSRHTKAQFLAHRVEAGVYLTDVKSMIADVYKMLIT